MTSTLLQQLLTASPLLGLSRWLRTDLILVATLLFLVFASWAMLMAAQASSDRPHPLPLVEPKPSPEQRHVASNQMARRSRRGRLLGTFGILLGLLGSLMLLVICAW
jgi:hypothetical protein